MQLWGITKKEIEETKAALRLKDREIEGMEEKHQMEIKVPLSTMHSGLSFKPGPQTTS